jgi:hypothetical protein
MNAAIWKHHAVFNRSLAALFPRNTAFLAVRDTAEARQWTEKDWQPSFRDMIAAMDLYFAGN